MKANELRIGNWINDNGYNSIIGVIDSHYHAIQISGSPRMIALETIEPIPITEEWLVKFGFVRLGNQETWFGRALWTKGTFAVMHGYGTTNGQRTRYDMIEFDYVHQLQNLYFALTGEELTIS